MTRWYCPWKLAEQNSVSEGGRGQEGTWGSRDGGSPRAGGGLGLVKV